MAELFELDRAAWDEWVATRPKVIQDMCATIKPNRLYRMKSTGHRVTVYSLSEDGTVTVDVTGEFNAVVMERRVFGVAASDLEECELPGPDEVVGALLQEPTERLAFINARRAENGLPALATLGEKP
jgi:hypothetical protein